MSNSDSVKVTGWRNSHLSISSVAKFFFISCVYLHKQTKNRQGMIIVLQSQCIYSELSCNG